MYILKLEANGQTTNYGYAVDFRALYKLLKFGIRRGVILYGPAELDHISQIRLLKGDVNARYANPIGVLERNIQGGSIEHVRTRTVPDLTEKRFVESQNKEALSPFRGAITARKKAAREMLRHRHFIMGVVES